MFSVPTNIILFELRTKQSPEGTCKRLSLLRLYFHCFAESPQAQDSRAPLPPLSFAQHVLEAWLVIVGTPSRDAHLLWFVSYVLAPGSSP